MMTLTHHSHSHLRSNKSSSSPFIGPFEPFSQPLRLEPLGRTRPAEEGPPNTGPAAWRGGARAMILLRILAYDQNNPLVMGQDAAPYLHKLVALLRHKQGPEAAASAKAIGKIGKCAQPVRDSLVKALSVILVMMLTQ